jgi:hypothetical protein
VFVTTALFQEPAEQSPDGPAEDPDAPSAEAPYGWTTDPVTGERRPKKTAGRRPKAKAESAPEPPRGTPSLEELKAQAKGRPKASEDIAPDSGRDHGFSLKGLKSKASTPKLKAASEPVPPFRAGPIAKGVNKIYKRAGKIVKVWDLDVGRAIIACTVKDEDDEDDVTVGEAWEELARTNPRIRAFLTKMITTGAWSTLFMAHMPILVAICLKDGIRARIPMLRLMDAFLVDDGDDGEEVPSEMAQMFGGINYQDVGQMMEAAQLMMMQMADRMPRGMNDVRDVQQEAG